MTPGVARQRQDKGRDGSEGRNGDGSRKREEETESGVAQSEEESAGRQAGRQAEGWQAKGERIGDGRVIGESVRGVARWYGNERFRGPVGGQAGGSGGLSGARGSIEGERREGRVGRGLGGHHRGRRGEGRMGGGWGKGMKEWYREKDRWMEMERERESSEEEAAMTTRRWFEFVSTRYHSSGSISTHVPSVLRIAISFSLPSSLSPLHSLSRFARFFLRRSIPQPASSSSLVSFLTLGERVLSLPLPPSLPSLPFPFLPRNASSSRDSRIGSRSTSLRLFPSLSLSLSIFLHRTAYQSISVPRSVSAFSHRFSRSPSRSFFRHGTASRSSLR